MSNESQIMWEINGNSVFCYKQHADKFANLLCIGSEEAVCKEIFKNSDNIIESYIGKETRVFYSVDTLICSEKYILALFENKYDAELMKENITGNFSCLVVSEWKVAGKDTSLEIQEWCIDLSL